MRNHRGASRIQLHMYKVSVNVICGVMATPRAQAWYDRISKKKKKKKYIFPNIKNDLRRHNNRLGLSSSTFQAPQTWNPPATETEEITLLLSSRSGKKKQKNPKRSSNKQKQIRKCGHSFTENSYKTNGYISKMKARGFR